MLRDASVETIFLNIQVKSLVRALFDSVFFADFKNTLENFLRPIFKSVINDVKCRHLDVPFYYFAYYLVYIALNCVNIGVSRLSATRRLWCTPFWGRTINFTKFHQKFFSRITEIWRNFQPFWTFFNGAAPGRFF